MSAIHQAVLCNARLVTPTIDYLVVAAGGSGGYSLYGGGGGGGGVLQGVDYAVAPGAAMSITFPSSGNATLGALTALKGGTGGGEYSYNDTDPGYPGGSGGGSRTSAYPSAAGGAGTPGQGTDGQGSPGLYEGYGGGAGASGAAGGSGIVSSITGSPVTYARGGIPLGTQAHQPHNTGHGGNGGWYYWNPYGGYWGRWNGGSGIVIISHLDTYPLAIKTTGNPECTNVGGRRIYTFKQAGSITF